MRRRVEHQVGPVRDAVHEALAPAGDALAEALVVDVVGDDRLADRPRRVRGRVRALAHHRVHDGVRVAHRQRVAPAAQARVVLAHDRRQRALQEVAARPQPERVGIDALGGHRVVRAQRLEHEPVVGGGVVVVAHVGERLERAAGDVLEQQRGGEAVVGVDRQLEQLAVAGREVDADALGLGVLDPAVDPGRQPPLRAVVGRLVVAAGEQLLDAAPPDGDDHRGRGAAERRSTSSTPTAGR